MQARIRARRVGIDRAAAATSLRLLATCALLLLAHQVHAADTPGPRYYITYSSIGIYNPAPGFDSPTESGDFINAVHASWTWSSSPLHLTIHCPAHATSFALEDFVESASAPAFTGVSDRVVVYKAESGYCSQYLNPGSAICAQMACRVDPTDWQYKMLAQCPTSTTFRSNPNRCECPAGYGWANEVASCRPIVEVDGTQNRSDCKNPGRGNPIYPLSGNKVERVDLGVALGDLRLALSYDSRSRLPSTGVAARPISGEGVFPGFGPMWSSNVHRWLMFPQWDAAAGVMALRGEGVLKGFVGLRNGQYRSADAGEADRVASSSQYMDMERNAAELYAGPRVYQINRQGVSYGFAYATNADATQPDDAAAARYLLALSDSFGRKVQFRYEKPDGLAPGRVSKLIDQAGQEIAFSYSAAGMLERIQWPDGSARRFVYERAELPWALTGVIDELGHRLSTFGYDETGRAQSTERAGGVGRYEVQGPVASKIIVTDAYDAQLDVILRTRLLFLPDPVQVRAPLGSIDAMASAQTLARRSLAALTQPAGSGCAASASHQSYDANGNLQTRDDFNANRTCYAHDPVRNLMTVRVEGLPATQDCAAVTATGAALPAGSRKTSTQWHPDWRLAAVLAEPGRITTIVYNGEPDPFNANAIASCVSPPAWLPSGRPIAVKCRQLEQATTDADGSLGFAAAPQPDVPVREWKWSYNAYGQVLTEDGPRTDVADLTSYAYYSDTTAEHVKGDLKSITNALGQTTQYSRYSPQGRLLESVDTNGVLSSFGYDLRNRLTSVSVGGQASSIEYDAAGQLRRVTLPDATYTGYEYDDAQRLRAIFDGQGNRIELTLDAAGNVVQQDVRDAAGTLRRQLTRVRDALGRVQQVTGRE